jgi:hypothetical protein
LKPPGYRAPFRYGSGGVNVGVYTSPTDDDARTSPRDDAATMPPRKELGILHSSTNNNQHA